MASSLDLLRRLANEKVEFVLVGGMAAVAHGSAIVTSDADVCIRFDLETLRRLFTALGGTNPRQRMHPDRPPLGDDPAQYVGFKNLCLSCDGAVLDLLGELLAVCGYDDAVRDSVPMDLGGFECRVLGLEQLIACKRALGRRKDLQVVEELEWVRSHRSPGRG